jgi:hypothetical protein
MPFRLYACASYYMWMKSKKKCNSFNLFIWTLSLFSKSFLSLIIVSWEVNKPISIYKLQTIPNSLSICIKNFLIKIICIDAWICQDKSIIIRSTTLVIYSLICKLYWNYHCSHTLFLLDNMLNVCMILSTIFIPTTCQKHINFAYLHSISVYQHELAYDWFHSLFPFQLHTMCMHHLCSISLTIFNPFICWASNCCFYGKKGGCKSWKKKIGKKWPKVTIFEGKLVWNN